MEISKKILVALMILPVLIVLFAVACWQNWGGIGTALSGVGGPVGKGFMDLAAAPLTWAVNGGGPTLAIIYSAFFAIVFGFAYWVWHWDIGYKIQNVTAPSTPTTSGYTNTMNREPADPEYAPT
jgi:hypothetical protein